ncbi:MAG TPA: RNA 2',3'-cyclic phosphodiesterase [Vicinamibacterales bacterium]|nr:RNA 2',3'-cyclic phosphodiesterase [Vicinamibacterales bacterium]
MRAFVAVELDEAARAVVAAEQTLARKLLGARSSSLRLVGPQQIHFTLVFLANVAEPLVEPLTAAMRQPISGLAPFRIRIGGFGVFPPRGAPRVLWLGLLDGVRQMTELQAAVAARVGALGLRLEDRAFRPHLTLARWRDARPSDRVPFERASPARAIAEMTVDRVTLFESRLSSEGASHVPLAQSPLSGTS